MEKENFKFSVVRKQFKKFGTEIDFQIVVVDDSQISQAEKNLEQAEKKCDEIEKIFSRFRQDSEISKINSQLGIYFQASPQLLEIAKSALKYHEETQGYFDPRIISQLEDSGYASDFAQVGSVKLFEKKQEVDFRRQLESDLVIKNEQIAFFERMDFAGIVKGYAADQIADFFSSCGWKNFLVDCGGDMFFAGKDKNENPWYIDIEGIAYQNLMLELRQKGIATSGIGKRKWEIEGKRFHHLVNPKNPAQYSFELKSVTVVARSTCQADIWAKTLFIMGSAEAKEFSQEKELACAILDYRGGAWISTELKKYLYKNNA